MKGLLKGGLGMKTLDDRIPSVSKPTCEGISFGFERLSSSANYVVTTTAGNNPFDGCTNKLLFYIVDDVNGQERSENGETRLNS